MAEAYLRALPLTFLPLQGNGDNAQDQGDEILVHLSLFDHWADLYGGRPMLVLLAHHEVGTERLVCIGHHHTEATDLVYVPRWILENLACDMTGGTTLYVQPWLDVVPSATHLVLRPLEEVPAGTDLRSAVEEKLDRYHVLETGSLLPLRLGTGEEVTLYVEHTEPALRVALGGEVTVEFLDRATVGAEGEAEAALEAAEERVPTPIPEAPAVLHPEEVAAAGAGAGASTGHVLGTADERFANFAQQTAEERMAAIRASWLERLASMRKETSE
jgi:hypothetical protein